MVNKQTSHPAITFTNHQPHKFKVVDWILAWIPFLKFVKLYGIDHTWSHLLCFLYIVFPHCIPSNAFKKWNTCAHGIQRKNLHAPFRSQLFARVVVDVIGHRFIVILSSFCLSIYLSINRKPTFFCYYQYQFHFCYITLWLLHLLLWKRLAVELHHQLGKFAWFGIVCHFPLF